MEALRFEDGLSALIRHDTLAILDHLALAELAGISPRAHGWLRERLDSEPSKKVWVRRLGEKSYDDIAALWATLKEGGSKEIVSSVRAPFRNEDDGRVLSLAFESVIEPLVMLGRGRVVDHIRFEMRNSLGSGFVERAAVALGACGEWDDALSILGQAIFEYAIPPVSLAIETLLWTHAYLQHKADTVLPLLASNLFHPHQGHAVGVRVWRLFTDQIRAGTDFDFPVLTKRHQSFGYAEAAAMAIAALEGTESAEETVAKLRGVLTPPATKIPYGGRGAKREWVSDELTHARICVAARRRDYAKLATLAQGQPSQRFFSWPAVIINALLEEGDWRGAADFAARYDRPKQPAIEGVEATRLDECLPLILATAAARDGDDAAARAHLAEHLARSRVIRNADQEQGEPKTSEPLDTGATASGLRAATFLAGAAEGVIPRRLLPVLLPVFRPRLIKHSADS
jgi:hypothetical protein